MRVWAEVDDQAARNWFQAFPVLANLQVIRMVTQGIDAAHRYMQGPEVLGKFPNPHPPIYPPPPGQGEVPGKYWSEPRTVPTRVTGALAYSVSAPATKMVGFGAYERSVGPRVWYARRQEYGYFNTRVQAYVYPRPVALKTAEWLADSAELDRMIDNALDQILR